MKNPDRLLGFAAGVGVAVAWRWRHPLLDRTERAVDAVNGRIDRTLIPRPTPRTPHPSGGLRCVEGDAS